MNESPSCTNTGAGNSATPFVHADHVSSDTISEVSSTCNCAAERLRTEERTYSIAPQAGGGWTSWSGAFTRFLVRFATLPTHCFVITQAPNQRYVQLMLGHGHACVEASSNEYLQGDFRLGAVRGARPGTAWVPEARRSTLCRGKPATGGSNSRTPTPCTSPSCLWPR